METCYKSHFGKLEMPVNANNAIMGFNIDLNEFVKQQLIQFKVIALFYYAKYYFAALVQ